MVLWIPVYRGNGVTAFVYFFWFFLHQIYIIFYWHDNKASYGMPPNSREKLDTINYHRFEQSPFPYNYVRLSNWAIGHFRPDLLCYRYELLVIALLHPMHVPLSAWRNFTKEPYNAIFSLQRPGFSEFKFTKKCVGPRRPNRTDFYRSRGC